LLYHRSATNLAQRICEDIKSVSPETESQKLLLEFKDPWDFEEVYGALFEFARNYPFDTAKEDYLIHITTGTHVAQICLFLLTEAHYFPAKLLQTSPPKERERRSPGEMRIIDLDLSRYDKIATRFQEEKNETLNFLKSGIPTRNKDFNRLIENIERVAIKSKSPILLMGPTGAGKSQLARKIYELKKNRHQLRGNFVEVNCATIRGDAAMSALFGHVRGSFTGALQDRKGLLVAADGGLLFLDEVGELGLDEQAMLLRALEEKRFMPVGSDKEIGSDFQLIAGTNRELNSEVREGKFREDLLARINLWTFCLPYLRDRPEDIEPNLDYELEQFARKQGVKITFNKESRQTYLEFATSKEALWKGNFRDLNASVNRMGTLAHGGRITLECVNEELQRLRSLWANPLLMAPCFDTNGIPVEIEAKLQSLDTFDRLQLVEVIKICQKASTMAEAGRMLFETSRNKKKTSNDSDRVRKYLSRFGLAWSDFKASS
ncbi:MAG: RNA repair transcriptional activator RtcR, partial [Verrucomicrobiales bacterium]